MLQGGRKNGSEGGREGDRMGQKLATPSHPTHASIMTKHESPNPTQTPHQNREHTTLAYQVLVELEDRSHVTAAVAVVGRGPHRDQVLYRGRCVSTEHFVRVGA